MSKKNFSPERHADGKMSFLRFPNQENVLILNTPNRQEILKDGPPLSQIKSNLLGRGAYGTVIKAIYKEKPVALKIIKNLKDSNKQMMRNESHILGWSHPNIVRILKIESTAYFAIVVMERFDGQCLQSVLDTTEVAFVHRVNIALDILAALKYCHKHNLLHMDVKPQNVMIFMKTPEIFKSQKNNCRRPFSCKLCDFGSSISLDEGPENLTKGSVKGTLRYMAPEALKEECLTAAADIYSLGITLWQMKYRLCPYSWLECNEVVAYQVVKHDLRPNALKLFDGNTSQPTISQTPLLECKQHSQKLTTQSIENLMNLLNECRFGEKPHKHMAASCPPSKISLKDLNGNGDIHSIKVKRDLQCEFTLNETIRKDDKRPHHHQAQLESEQAERLYEDIFISCWHSDYKQRPSTSELYKQFKTLLY